MFNKKIQTLTSALDVERQRGEHVRAKLAALMVKQGSITNGFSSELTKVEEGLAATSDDRKSTVDLMLGTTNSVASASRNDHRSDRNGEDESLERELNISSFHLSRQAKAQENSWRARCLEAEASRKESRCKTLSAWQYEK